MTTKENLLYLFDRPLEPLFLPKGSNRDVKFDLPSPYYADRFKFIPYILSSHFQDSDITRIPVKFVEIPNLEYPMTLERQEPFSVFIPKHRKIAAALIEIFMNAKTIEDLQSVAVYANDRVNPNLFNYALSVAILHREDTKGLNIPLLIESFPDKFLNSKIFTLVREEALLIPEGLRRPIEVPDVGRATLDDEGKNLTYFREDIGVNLQYWNWHLLHPNNIPSSKIVVSDRRGELFYYLLEQILARYNAELLSNRMSRIKPITSMRETILEPYFPKIVSLLTSHAWPARSPNVQLLDLNREHDEIQMNISDLETYIDRFKLACNEGFIKNPKGENIPLTEYDGIDILGNLMQSSTTSINKEYYGDIHNMGNIFMAFAHDPGHRHLESFGVLGEPATALRDPLFYQWHAFKDKLFQIHKEKIRPYNEMEIGYDSIRVSSIEVKTDGDVDPNIFDTFWQQSDVDLSSGMDYLPPGNIYARVRHLQHTPFKYTIKVVNNKNMQSRGTMRIFLAPKFDEDGKEFQFGDLRLLMMEMDRFEVNLHPGENIIGRKSTESTVTSEYNRKVLNKGPMNQNSGQHSVHPESPGSNDCGCGWPQHMLIPRGSPESDNGGFACQLFVMVSNYDDDHVEQDLTGACTKATIFCGIRDRLYPDKRNMGYPFDRKATKNDGHLQDFLLPNMNVVDCKIIFRDITVERASQLNSPHQNNGSQ